MLNNSLAWRLAYLTYGCKDLSHANTAPKTHDGDTEKGAEVVAVEDQAVGTESMDHVGKPGTLNL